MGAQGLRTGKFNMAIGSPSYIFSQWERDNGIRKQMLFFFKDKLLHPTFHSLLPLSRLSSERCEEVNFCELLVLI